MNNDYHSRRLIDEMKRYYDARAPWHDYYMSYKSIEDMERLLKPIIDTVASMIINKRVLEVACGTGNWTQVLARRARSVTAIDVSPTALGIARRKLAAYPNASLIQCDAYDVSGIDGLFDVLFAADWWSHMPNQALPSFLESIIGKLEHSAPGIFLEIAFKDVFQEESCYYDSDNNRISRRTLPDGSEFDVVKNFPDERELRRILSAYVDAIDYHEFADLQRWMVVFRAR
jgi:SAM-dependent methyltransferase